MSIIRTFCKVLGGSLPALFEVDADVCGEFDVIDCREADVLLVLSGENLASVNSAGRWRRLLSLLDCSREVVNDGGSLRTGIVTEP